jgi:uncharacterized protein (UPF0332 family)
LAAEVSFDHELYNAAAGRAYYAMFTAARVLLNELAGFAHEDVRRHRAVMRYFSSDFIRPGLIDLDLGRAFLRSSHLRGTADYEPRSVSREDAKAVIVTMRDFIATAEKLLAK